MNVIGNALGLWKNRKEYKGTTLQSRLILFFSLLICSILFLFMMLLLLFGINGSGQNTVQKYLDSELSYLSSEIENDMGNMAATGIQLSQSFSTIGDAYFKEQKISASDLQNYKELIEPLLDKMMPTLISTVEYNTCGGAFVILDASVSSTDENKRSGFFLKKTQPVYSVSLSAKNYCLRGSAILARNHEIQLMGQWSMEYEEEELDFFSSVMNTAKENSSFPLSRLYFWSDRVKLIDNSETGVLLCVPLISSDKTCWGVCGMEISDRMFKQLYSPNEGEYQGVFVSLSPGNKEVLFADRGLIAGNSYLTGNQMTGSLSYVGTEYGFPSFQDEGKKYSGSFKNISLYASGSPYEEEEWTVVVLMQKVFLEKIVRGKSTYLFVIFSVLLLFSLVATFFVSKRYLRPIQKGISSIRDKSYESETGDFGILEIDDLFENLAKDIRDHKEELERLSQENKDTREQMKQAQTQVDQAQSQIEKANAQIERLTDKRKKDISPEEYELFLQNLSQLTSTEQRIFELYLEGKTTEEILSIQQIKENTLKYHNRNIYSKLGVTSRKQLLQYATIMQSEDKF